MIIDKIILTNYKCFEGIVELDKLGNNLTTDKRIILIGGLNGSGKTTIFEAILLCLYGQRNKTLWPSKGAKREDYNNYICAITNNNKKLKEIKTKLSIELWLKNIDITEIPLSLKIKRTYFIVANKDIEEEFIITNYEDNKEFEYYSKEGWEDFIQEIIPYDTSQFFFFDGEKIQDFVKDEDKEFSDSLEKLLGITQYKTLLEDIEKTRKKIFAEYNNNAYVNIKLAEIDKLMAEIENKIDDLEEEINEKNDLIENIEKRINEIDIETKRISRVNADTKEEYDNIKDELKNEESQIKFQIIKAIQDDIPFLITYPIGKNVVDQIEMEEKVYDIRTSQENIFPKIQMIIEKLFEGQESIPPLTKTQQLFYTDKLTKVLTNILLEFPDELKNLKEIHRLSKNDSESIKIHLIKCKDTINNLSDSLKRLQIIEPKIKDIKQTIKKTNNPEVNQLYQEKGSISKEKDKLIEDKIIISGNILKFKAEIESKKRQRTELEEKVEQNNLMKVQIEYCKDLKNTLFEYSNIFKTKRVERLQEFSLKMWRKLARKPGQINLIKINSENNFNIELFDIKNRLIDKTKLSAGEKEILATSLIWSLTQIAERSLPIVIDTPLARLDSIFRKKIVENFYPNAGKQVILLSTDEELIGEDLESIRPYVAKSYLLQKFTADESTKIIEGYFE